MPDISMCLNGEKCPKSKHCYRFCAVPDSWQSYSDFYVNNDRCEHFLKIEKGDKICQRRIKLKR